MSKVVVIGAGISGLSTAYFLRKKGYDVIIAEVNSAFGKVASFANGSQLSFSHIQPIYLEDRFKFSILKKKQKYDNCLNLKNEITKSFIKQQIDARHHHAKNVSTLSKLANFSMETINEICTQDDFSKYIKSCGIIHLFESYSEALKEEEAAKSYNMPFKVFSKNEFKNYEPNLEYFNVKFEYGVFYPEDKTSNCYDICKLLFNKLKEFGVSFLFNSHVKKLNILNNVVKSITLTDGTLIEADFFVCANGTKIPDLIENIGLHYPIYPLRGYSVTFNKNNFDYFPFLGLIDKKRKMVYSTYKDCLRVAGFFDFGINDTGIINSRLQDFKDTIFEVFPLLKQNTIIHQWTESRHFTPSSVPIIGKTKLFSNLFINGGHGALGFTLSFGAAKIISELI